MKKQLFVIGAALLTTSILVFGVNYLLSFHKVTFSLGDDVETIAVLNSKDKEIKRFDSSDSLLLTSGKYYIIPEGKNISNSKIPFTVDKETLEITVDPSYTEEYLRKELTKEQAAITAAVAAKYPDLISGYTLTDGRLYKKGEWFGGLLKPKVSDTREQKDAYRIVLHKTDKDWEVVRRPEYVLTSSRYTTVPVDILKDINSIVQ